MLRFWVPCVWLALAAYGDDRPVVEWILRQGGRVTLAGVRVPVEELADLPAGELTAVEADLTGTQMVPNDLARLGTLAELRDLYLPGPMWNPGAGSTLDANEQLKHLAGLRKLERLQFSLHFLTNVNIQDKGLDLLAPLTGLRELRLAQTRVKGRSLAPFVELRSLDLSYTPFGDEGMGALSGLRHLERLLLRDTLVTDAGLKAVEGLTGLKELDLYGCRITDEGVRSLAKLRKLQNLNLLGASITDTGLEALAGLEDLRELNLYRTAVTNAGLAKLRGLKALAALDVRYTRVTAAGVESLRAALPACGVRFLDSGVRAAKKAVRPRDAGEQALAEWVRALGGKAEFEGGRLKTVVLAGAAVRDEEVQYLSQAPALERLSLESTEVGDLGTEAIARLSNLLELNLAQTTISDAGVEKLATLKRLRRLNLSHSLVRAPKAWPAVEELHLAGTAVSSPPAVGGLRRLNLGYSDVTDEALAALPEGIEVLDLTATDIGDPGLAHLARLAGLRELLLSYARITDKGLAALEGLSRLERLEVARTRLTDAGAASLSRLPALAEVNLAYTKIGDKGLASFKGLRRLELDSTGVTDGALDTLRAMTGLKRLNLYHTLVTEKGFEALKAALPACEIVWERDSALPNRRGA